MREEAAPVAQSGALFYGDNLDVLRRHVDDESIDLVYLDPPFNSNATYNILFAEQDGSRSASQIKAFGDTWRWDQEAASAFEEVVENGGEVSSAMQAFRTILSESNMLAYLAMMAPRLVELRRVLKPSGSIFLHCDPTASHYLKLLMDATFDPSNFRNEVVWHYRRWTGRSQRFQRMHDTIFFYTKSSDYYFNQILTPYTKGSKTRKEQGVLHRFKRGEEPILVSDGKVEKEGVPENDVWQIPFVAPSAAERLGYPTQKPEALLTRVIEASCPPDGVVLDPFCGCGTTIAVAERLGRRWVGIDITYLATHLIKSRMMDAFGDTVPYTVIGEPTTVEDAARLAKEDRHQFEAWALGLVGARTTTKKKGADHGIDGRLIFHEKPGGETHQVVISVKSGKTGVGDVRDLRGVIEREEAEIGLLISMREPTGPMKTEAAAAGFYQSGAEGVGSWGKHPRLQLLTVDELLDGRRIDMPPLSGNLTFRRAPEIDRRRSTTEPLFRNLSTPPKLEEMFPPAD